jgi:ATP-binding cassette subfamily B multidrug efflux pump
VDLNIRQTLKGGSSPIPFPKRLHFVGQYVLPHRRNLLIGIGGLIGRDGVAFTIPLLIRAAVDSLTHQNKSHPGWSIAEIALAMVAVAIPRSAFQTLARLKVMSSSREIEYAMRKDLLRHLFRLDASFWDRTSSGDVMASATNDLNAVRMMLGPGLTSLFESVVSLPVAFVVMGAVDLRLTAIALLPAPLAAILLICFGNIIRRRFDIIQGMFSSMSAAVYQNISGTRVIRSFVREEAEQRRFEAMNQSYVKANQILAIYGSSLDPLLSFITGLSVMIVLWYGGTQVLAHTLSVGSFVMFTTYMTMLVRPITSLGRVVNMMQRGMASVGRLCQLFSEEPGIEPRQDGLPVLENPDSSCSITLHDATVRYGSLSALSHVDLNIPEGATVAIMGATGSGKSTLVKLVSRLIDPTEGSIRINGVDCRKLSLNELRSLVGVVPQETFLFSMTLADNISLGVKNAARHEVIRAAEIAGLAPDVMGMPDGYDTIVGERGVMLSGGQKQRIAIARAILTNPRILVLDDALSSVDSSTEQRILDHLTNIMEERTTLVITHRVATAKQANHIVVFERGRILEQGTHNSLMAANTQYARLARLQFLEQELEIL